MTSSNTLSPDKLAHLLGRPAAVICNKGLKLSHWSHRGERCTFGLVVEEFGLETEALKRLATIVRGAVDEPCDWPPTPRKS